MRSAAYGGAKCAALALGFDDRSAAKGDEPHSSAGVRHLVPPCGINQSPWGRQEHTVVESTPKFGDSRLHSSVDFTWSGQKKGRT
jgi:hypothetical protein